MKRQRFPKKTTIQAAAPALFTGASKLLLGLLKRNVAILLTVDAGPAERALELTIAASINDRLRRAATPRTIPAEVSISCSGEGHVFEKLQCVVCWN